MIIQAPLGQETELCYQRVAWQSLKMGQRLPRYLRRPKRRDLLRSRAMIGDMALVPQGGLKGISLCTIPETHRTDTRVSMLAEAAHDRRIVMRLLLTLLEVRASHVPRICRRHLHQRKHWRERSFFWTFLPPRRSLTNGEPPSRILSASPTQTDHSKRVHHDSGLSHLRGPVMRRLGEVRLRSTLPLDGKNGRSPGRLMFVRMIPRHRPIRGPAATNV